MKHKFAVAENGGKETSCCGCCYCTQTQRKLAFCLIGLPILVIVSLVIAVLIRAATLDTPFTLQKLDTSPKMLNATSEEKESRANLLGKAITFQTISYNKSFTDTEALKGLHSFLRENYAQVFEASFIDVKIVNEYSLLFRVEGNTPTANPYLLCGHLDVVPAGDVEAWSRPPFSGEIFEEEGEKFVFGRGSMDDKQSVLGILEALKFMINEDHQPERTFYVAFGHDEEVGGDRGAGKLAEELREILDERGEKLSFILDEGMFVMDKIFPSITDPVAYIGVVEKGWAEVNLTVRGTQGHSSTPPKESSIGILSKAISTLEENPQPSRFGSSVEYDTIEYLAPHASFAYKLVLGNLWLFKPIVSKILANDAGTDAIQRTTTAVTIVKGGVKNNVVPAVASALINHRVHPADSAQGVVDQDTKTIDDSRVKATLLDNFPATKISNYHSDSCPFQIIANSVIEVYPSAILTPGVMVANTDTKHYLDLCDDIYRFQPIRLQKSDLSRFHGIDERISVENFHRVVQFYYRVVHNADYDLVEKEANNDDIFQALPIDYAENDNFTTY